MARKFHINGRRVVAIDPITSYEARARARYLQARLLPGTYWILTDAALYRRVPHGSDGLRAAADKALEVELEASIKGLKKP